MLVFRSATSLQSLTTSAQFQIPSTAPAERSGIRRHLLLDRASTPFHPIPDLCSKLRQSEYGRSCVYQHTMDCRWAAGISPDWCGKNVENLEKREA